MSEDMYKYVLDATPKDGDGYYIPNWGRSDRIVVYAKTKKEALNKADAALGELRRGYYWIFHVVRIVALPPCRCAEEGSKK